MVDQFRVAIVGGGLAGLAAAVHLEKLGIDWFLLESYDEIAPELGASIGLAANGMQILDQLGVHEEIERQSSTASSVAAYDGDGTKLYDFELLPRMRANHGFDMRFTERSTVLKILHDKIQAKENIYVGQRVSKITHVGEKVELITCEGKTFEADIVIGADGIHSRVRAEMWRNAQEDGSKVFGDSPGSDVTTEYGCIFGISDPTNDLEEGMIRQVHMKDKAIGLIVGREKVVYWFRFFKLAKKHMGIDLPRFTEEDEKEMVQDSMDVALNPGTTFGELYSRKRISIITPLPNHLFPRWHYRRTICIGDAVCKSQPIAGQGGCSALESTAAVADHIYAALKENGMKSLSSAQVESIFTKVTEVRQKRSTAVVNEGLLYMSLAFWSNAILKFIDRWIVGWIPSNTLVDLMFLGAAGGYHSNTLPKPVPKFVIGTGERAAPPKA